jgi:hypothetical protein
MKIYLAGVPKAYGKLPYKVLFSYFTIKYPDQKWGAKSNFNYYTNENILSSSLASQSSEDN